jgi:hypothetical protein
VPYYLIFYPDNQEFTLYHLENDKYVSVKPNERSRYAIPELELELALVDGWIRYWWRGEMLPLPAQLQDALDEAIRRAKQEKHRADEAEKREAAKEQTIRSLQEELARLRAQTGDGKSA